MVKSTIALLAASIALILSSTVESAPVSLAKSGQTGALISESSFCIFLPPKYGGNIADNEDRAVAFCTESISTAPDANLLPDGFIQSAHWKAEDDWVQVTGRIDGSKYGLSSDDEGGQYDMRAPVGATCAGYEAFVQITEPDQGTYCIRCCNDKSSCPVNKSTDGCAQVLGGDYS